MSGLFHARLIFLAALAVLAAVYFYVHVVRRRG